MTSCEVRVIQQHDCNGLYRIELAGFAGKVEIVRTCDNRGDALLVAKSFEHLLQWSIVEYEETEVTKMQLVKKPPLGTAVAAR